MSNFLNGQDYFSNGSAIAGFNRHVSGESYADCFRYDSERGDHALHQGWQTAERLVAEGKVFFCNLAFHRTHEKCNRTWSGAFHYGGTIVCNGCERNRLEKDWWWIKCFMDGNAWMCHGPGFENLQESSNFAFGDTREQAIENYGNLMMETAP